MLCARRYAEVCSRTRAEIERRGHGGGTQSWGKNSRHVACQAGQPKPTSLTCKLQRRGRRKETSLLHFSLALGNLCIACKTSQTFPGRPLRQCLLRSDVGITRGGYYVTAADGGQEVKVFSFRNRASPSVKPRSNCTVGKRKDQQN